MTMPRFTLARRVCSFCRRTTGLRLWPWNGHFWIDTHGICPRCSARVRGALDEGIPRSA